MLSVKKNKIIFTGGHAATTAISVIEEIRKQRLPWDLYWVGPKWAIEGKKTPAAASKYLPQYGVYYQPIIAGRLQKKWTKHTISSLFKVPVGFLHAFLIIFKIRPRLVVSFGGYAALPVVVAAWFFKVPVIVHSQTIVFGLANRLSIFFAKCIALSRESDSLSPRFKKKAVLIGLPVREEILSVAPKRFLSKNPTVYITGGSTGSQIINEVVEEILPQLIKRFRIIHQTGELDYARFRDIKVELLPDSEAERYEVGSFFEKIGNIYEKADIIISRAGANTISEILIVKRPCILIPHPWVVLDEQVENAKFVEKTGLFKVLPQKDLNSVSLIKMINEVVENWENMIKTETTYSMLDKNASRKFVDLLAKWTN